jgi:glutathione S-transferase
MCDVGDPGAREALKRVGGKGQVPCLVINSQPLYESRDIIRFLEKSVRPPRSA